MTPDQRLAVAARIAAVTVYSNKYAIWTGVRPAALDEEDVLVSTLTDGTEFVGEDEFPVDEEAVKEALGSGLFSARGPERLGWAHQTYAEFLAAHYLGILMHRHQILRWLRCRGLVETWAKSH